MRTRASKFPFEMTRERVLTCMIIEKCQMADCFKRRFLTAPQSANGSPDLKAPFEMTREGRIAKWATPLFLVISNEALWVSGRVYDAA